MGSKTFLVTGGTRGIGKEIVRQLAAEGHEVYLSARTLKEGEEAVDELSANGNVRMVLLDLNVPESQEKAAAQILKEVGALDGLINNAGICLDFSLPTTVTLEALRMHFETNLFGTIMVTQNMLPLLRAGKSKTIVNVSTALGSLGLQGEESWSYSGVNLIAYNSSKTALNMFTVSLAKELRAEGFKVNSVNPGHVATDLGGANAPGTVEQGAAIFVRCALSEADGQTGLFLSSGGVVPW